MGGRARRQRSLFSPGARGRGRHGGRWFACLACGPAGAGARRGVCAPSIRGLGAAGTGGAWARGRPVDALAVSWHRPRAPLLLPGWVGRSRSRRAPAVPRCVRTDLCWPAALHPRIPASLGRMSTAWWYGRSVNEVFLIFVNVDWLSFRVSTELWPKCNLLRVNFQLYFSALVGCSSNQITFFFSFSRLLFPGEL